MTAAVCTYGSEPRAAAPAYILGSHALWGDVFGDVVPLVIPVLAPFVGQYFDVTAICTAPRPVLPDMSDPGFWIGGLTGEGLKRYIEAKVWDDYAVCLPPPGGCAAVTAFDDSAPGLVSLTSLNASQEGGSEGELPENIQNARVVGTSGYTIISLASHSPAEGDYVLACIQCGAAPTSIPDGFSLVTSVGGDGQNTIYLYEHWAGSSEPGSYVWGGTLLYTGLVGNWRGVLPTAPIDDLATVATASGSPAAMPVVTTLGVNRMLVGYLHTNGSAAPGTFPGSYTILTVADLNPFYHQAAEQSQVVEGDSPTENYTVGGADTHSSAILVALAPVPVGNYYRWVLESSDYYHVGYPATVGDPAEDYAVVNVDGGYWIEERYPVSLGGTGAEGQVTLDIYNYAQSEHTQVVLYRDSITGLAVYPCHYVPVWDEEPTPPPDWENPWPTTPASLEGIAATVDALEAKIDVLAGVVNSQLAVWGVLTGPYAAIVGQAQESVGGTLGELMESAVAAVSNYEATGYSEQLLASGVTGDYTTSETYTHYRIEVTTLPAYAGSRGGATRLYEVNSRAQQIGWMWFQTSTGLLDYNLLTWDNGHVRHMEGPVVGMGLYLMPGVVADVYGVHIDYTPRVT